MATRNEKNVFTVYIYTDVCNFIPETEGKVICKILSSIKNMLK